MDSIIDDLKNAWKRPNNSLPQFIIINVGIFLVLATIGIFSRLAGTDYPEIIRVIFWVPANLGEFIMRPWTIITYAFAHDPDDFFHVLFNMLVMYWFGKLIVEYLGNQKLVNLYILGAMAGAALYLVFYNTIPYFAERSYVGMIGASAAVYAITVAAATLLPNYTFYLLLFGPVKIKYIAAFYIIISYLGITGGNAGGNIAHLGGAALGFIYIRQLQKGNDLGAWIPGVAGFFMSFFKKQERIKVSHKRANPTRSANTRSSGNTATNIADQAEIDTILDKISQSGYDSLTQAEKQKLFNASKKG